MPESAVTIPEHALLEGALTTLAPTDVGELPPDLLADSAFPLRYAKGDLLGEGGMGVVRACVDRRIGREVAIKIVRPGDGSRGDLKARFLREACVQGQLEHPAIVPVYDLGRDPDGTLYFTMKRVRGVDARGGHRRSPRRPRRRAEAVHAPQAPHRRSRASASPSTSRTSAACCTAI